MYRILVIEDDFSLAQIIKRQIESWGHDVRLITDFQHVIPAFVEYDPHMVLISMLTALREGEWTIDEVGDLLPYYMVQMLWVVC